MVLNRTTVQREVQQGQSPDAISSNEDFKQIVLLESGTKRLVYMILIGSFSSGSTRWILLLQEEPPGSNMYYARMKQQLT